MSIPDQIKEISAVLKRVEKTQDELDKGFDRLLLIEASAAKIIKEIIDKISECPCNYEILSALGNQENPIVLTPNKETNKGKEKESDADWKPQYTFPNFQVGNKNIGQEQNPNSKKWPFK